MATLTALAVWLLTFFNIFHSFVKKETHIGLEQLEGE